jgi:hypothetical protein
MLEIMSRDVPECLWSEFDDATDLSNLVEQLVRGEVDGQISSGVILVCGEPGHSSLARECGTEVVVAHFCPEDAISWVRWLKRSDNQLHWSQRDDLTGVAQRLREHALLFAQEVQNFH